MPDSQKRSEMPQTNRKESQQLMSLSDVPVGSEVIINSLELPASDQEFLMRIGFVPGAAVEFVGRGPINGPMIYRIQGSDVALRQDSARMIYVELSPRNMQETQ